ncbi:hypothetical protein LEP1GSC110_0949 [Leptospira interrogans serovar Medanensis str. UT053]|nr:hypothetical protein LEP1GSC110_0949 [Leptospira interrogans serovar Medanensis str. UT053]
MVVIDWVETYIVFFLTEQFPLLYFLYLLGYLLWRLVL